MTSGKGGPEVTVLLPTYRRPKQLDQAIQSVLAQSHPHLRVLVSDNASGDETPEVVAKWASRDARVHYRCHPRNLGARANFKLAMEAVETPWFTFLSDDDLLFPWFLELAIRCLNDHPRAKFFCAPTLLYNDATGGHRVAPPTRHWATGLNRAGERTVEMLEHQFFWTSCVFATELRDLAGDFEPAYGFDVVFLLKAAACFDFCVSHVPCSGFLHRPGGLYAMSAREWERSIRELKRACRDWCSLPERELDARFTKLCEKKVALSLRDALVNGRWDQVDHALDYFANRGTSGLSTRRRRRLQRYAVLARLQRTWPWLPTAIRPTLRVARRARTAGWWRPWRRGLKAHMDFHFTKVAQAFRAERSALEHTARSRSAPTRPARSAGAART